MVKFALLGTVLSWDAARCDPIFFRTLWDAARRDPACSRTTLGRRTPGVVGVQLYSLGTYNGMFVQQVIISLFQIELKPEHGLIIISIE